MSCILITKGDDTDSKFRIDSESGLIETTSSPLDRETSDLYRLIIAATDSGVPSRMVWTTSIHQACLTYDLNGFDRTPQK